jgi:2,4-dienoyl-CoA reductase-like NADH-dependent reductase (Old Yellow Enzyme family)
MRFPLQVIAAVRRAVGDTMPVIFRISGDEHQEQGLTLADVCAIAPQLVAAGVDLIDVSAGMYETNWWITQPMEMPQAVLAPLARFADLEPGVSGSTPSAPAQGRASDGEVGRALHADPVFCSGPRRPIGRPTYRLQPGCSDMHARGFPSCAS